MDTLAKEEFAAFFETAERRLRLSLTGAFGVEAGYDAAAESLAWACQNWDCVRDMKNPMGYLYRVGRTAALRALGHETPTQTTELEMHPALWELPNFEPNLAKFLAELSERQRVAVWMVHGLGFTNSETAEVLECSRPTVGTHVRRGLAKLRRQLGVTND